MNSSPNLTATLSRDYLGGPLITLDDAPFNGLEASPERLRALARQLNELADMASQLPLKSHRSYRPMKATVDAGVRVSGTWGATP